MNQDGTRTGRPRFTGVTSFADALGRFEFRHPSDWFRSDLEGGRDGVIVGPDPADDATHFAVAVTDLGVQVTAADSETLREGFADGIAGLPDVSVEGVQDDTYNDIVKLERTFTFAEGGVVRKRRSWALYADHWQFAVEFQGSSPAEFHYWLPMGNYCFMSFQLPLALWFATDNAVRTES